MELKDLLRRVHAMEQAASGPLLTPLDVLYCYRLLLGREPDVGGWQFWQTKAAQGTTLEEAVTTFLSSDEGRARLAPEAELVHTRRGGISIFVDPSDPSVARELIETRDYEPHVSAFLERALKASDGAFVDVGSNIGWYLLLAARASPRCRLIGFEPNPANVQLCLRSLRQNGIEDALVFSFALTDRQRILGLTYVGSNGFVKAGGGTSLVLGIPGDPCLAAEGHISIVKIDVEGHEPLALRGLAKTIETHRPLIVSEFHPKCLRENAGVDPEGYLDQLRGLGYGISVIERQDDGREAKCDSNADVLALWDRENNAARGNGEVHLDIVARPLRPSG